MASVIERTYILYFNFLFHTGSIPYRRIGCFADNQQLPRPLPELLFDESAFAKLMNYTSWNEYLPDAVCRCAEAAKMKTYSHFSLQEFGKCFSGPKAGSTYNKVTSYNTSQYTLSQPENHLS